VIEIHLQNSNTIQLAMHPAAQTHVSLDGILVQRSSPGGDQIGPTREHSLGRNTGRRNSKVVPCDALAPDTDTHQRDVSTSGAPVRLPKKGAHRVGTSSEMDVGRSEALKRVCRFGGVQQVFRSWRMLEPFHPRISRDPPFLLVDVIFG